MIVFRPLPKTTRTYLLTLKTADRCGSYFPISIVVRRIDEFRPGDHRARLARMAHPAGAYRDRKTRP
jgi:hypothetical protein